MKSIKIALLGLTLLQINCINMTDTITGSVVDGNIGLPIPNARIELAVYDFNDKLAKQENPVIYTDDDGIYSWSYTGTMLLVNGGGNGYPSKVIMTVSKDGYKSFTSPDYIKLSKAGIYNVKLVP